MQLISPNWEEFCCLARPGCRIPVWKEIIADTETPITLVQKLMGTEGDLFFLLESAEGGERVGRYSFVGFNPELLFVSRGGKAKITLLKPEAGPRYGLKERSQDCLDSGDADGAEIIAALRGLLRYYPLVAPAGCPRFCGGAVGYFGYEFVRCLEKIPAPARESSFPDVYLMFFERIYIFDHLRRTIILLVNTVVSEEDFVAGTEALQKIYAQAAEEIGRMEAALLLPLPGNGNRVFISLGEDWRREKGGVRSNFTSAGFMQAVEQAKEYIYAGDIFQVVISQKFSTFTSAPGLDIYRALRVVNPSPYMFYIGSGDFEIIGSSPEAHVRLEGKRAVVRPIAGTRRRGHSEAEDRELAAELKNDEKEKAEHVMLVDLARNDLGRVCAYGSVQVEEFMTVEYYSHVMHLVSQVSGELKEGEDALSLLAATFPAGTVSGAPKIRAMEIIAALEPEARGPYAGALGYLSFNGNMDTAIIIRTFVRRGEELSFQAGAGIVADSIPAKEYEETLRKADALQKVLDMLGSREDMNEEESKEETREENGFERRMLVGGAKNVAGD